MRFIRTLFSALVLVVFIAAITMVATHAKADLDDIENTLNSIKEYATKSTDDNIERTEEINNNNNANVSPSYIYTYTMPDAVVGDDLLSYNNDYNSQPPQVGQTEMDYIDSKITVDTSSVDYETVLGISYNTIYEMIKYENKSIWQIATEKDKINLLENVYCAYYSEMIIQMVNEEVITKDNADIMLEYVMTMLSTKECPTIDQLLATSKATNAST